eukprot:TRINITY_DN19893_c1_g1_i4.p1 TRINITY_DN19893_c1_g1~~TRINITY_DN19893_c1_g1_i4.p1  ORF type:complete len:349 (-),score=81.01 TRINITY_DN19893_c1_g1_i4:254-1300(-)
MGDYDPTVDGEEVDLGEDDDQTPAHNTAVLQDGQTVLHSASRPQPPKSLNLGGEDGDGGVKPSWTGGMGQGCAPPVFQPFGEPTSNIPLNTPTSPGAKGNKLESIKNWTISTYKCSRQSLYEKLGKTNRTVDVELESQIENLRQTQRRYANILKLSRALTSYFYHVVSLQNSLGDCFSELAHKSPELQKEFSTNAETQKTLSKNGEQLLAALNFFVSSVNTLANRTMEDTITTVKQYETARVEFDAYRCDLEYYTTAPTNDVNQMKLTETQALFNSKKGEFEKLRSDVQIKLKFLDENRVKVMQKQLLLFHNAVAAYFSGNNSMLETTMKQFSIKARESATTPSWLET